jgi:DNA-binding CsgD family transcriptional regulator
MKNIYTHPNFVFTSDIQDICKPLQSLGISYFSHVIIDENGKFSAIGTCPSFSELYVKKEYYNFDIHRAPAQQGQNHVIWDHIERDPKLNELYDDFKSFSFGHSFTISHQDLNGCNHYYDFSAKLGDGGINDSYLRNLDSLRMFILYFNERVNSSRDLKKAHDMKFTMQGNDEKRCEHENTNQLTLPINRIYFSRDIYLTFREFQCLDSLSRGKTIEEIATDLCITARTMKAHICSIKEKLRCKNLFQLGLAYQTWKANNPKNPVSFP